MGSPPCAIFRYPDDLRNIVQQCASDPPGDPVSNPPGDPAGDPPGDPANNKSKLYNVIIFGQPDLTTWVIHVIIVKFDN